MIRLAKTAGKLFASLPFVFFFDGERADHRAVLDGLEGEGAALQHQIAVAAARLRDGDRAGIDVVVAVLKLLRRRDVGVAVQQDVPLLERRVIIHIVDVAVGGPDHVAVQPQRGVIGHDGELQHHLVHLAVTVAPDAQQLLAHVVEHLDHPLGRVVPGQVVARAVVEDVAEQQQLADLLLPITLNHLFTPVCRTVQVRCDHPFHLVSSLLFYAGCSLRSCSMPFPICSRSCSGRARISSRLIPSVEMAGRMRILTFAGWIHRLPFFISL